METFKLRNICNELLTELKESTQNKNIIKLSVDIQLPDKFKGSPTSLIGSITNTSVYLSKILINGVINIEIIHRSIHYHLITAHILVAGLGSSRFHSTATEQELNSLLKNSEVKMDYATNESQVSFEFSVLLEANDIGQSAPLLQFNKKKILIAEDNEINAMVFASFLEEWGMEVFTAINGAEAISQVHDLVLDGILMDIHMPVLNGNQATKKIREFNSTIPIIALTASTREEDIKEALACGANEYLLKPVSSTNLFQVLSKYL